MATDIVVSVESVWKKFRKGQRYDSLRDLVPALVRSALGRSSRASLAHHEFWALRDVSFQVARGEALGVIGRNGGGKSTLLKVLTRILGPTQGRCATHGRTGALIEVAAGFHHDLTGRENVYLQGAILGMKRHEITRRFDAIVAFAGLDTFIDTPVKRYSSGMSARLGFSIAAHLEADVLVVDEVLGVGDTSFQEKCAERMKQFKREGTAIVFVSHNLQAVSALCDTVLYLDSAPVACGDPARVLERYLADASAASQPVTSGALVTFGSDLRLASGLSASAVAPGASLAFSLRFRAVQALSAYRVAFRVYRSTDGLPVYDASWTGEELGVSTLADGDTLTVEFGFRANLARGHYHVAFHAYHDPTASFLVHTRPAAVFTVEEERTYAGVADLDVTPRAAVRAPSVTRAALARRDPHWISAAERDVAT